MKRGALDRVIGVAGMAAGMTGHEHRPTRKAGAIKMVQPGAGSLDIADSGAAYY